MKAMVAATNLGQSQRKHRERAETAKRSPDLQLLMGFMWDHTLRRVIIP